jgi:hypothetical protein
MDFEFKYLDTEHTKSLINVIKFIVSPDLFYREKNLKSVATKLSIQENRYATIRKAVQKIKKAQAKDLINDIKIYDEIVIEFSNALKIGNQENKNDEIVKFLISLLPEVKVKLKINVFETIFIQDKQAAFSILDTEKENNLKDNYLEQAKKNDPEAAFAYLISRGYKDLNINELNMKNLFKYIYQIQLNCNTSLLDVIDKTGEQWRIIISFIKEKIKNEDFRALYIVSSNEQFFNDEIVSNDFLRKNIEPIKDFVRIMNNKYEGHQLDDDISIYIQRWEIKTIVFHLKNIEIIDKNYAYILLERIFLNMSKFVANIDNENDCRIIVSFILASESSMSSLGTQGRKKFHPGVPQIASSDKLF